MLYFIIAGILVLLIIINVALYFYYKNKLDFLYIKVKEADNNLDILLQKKLEILLKLTVFLEKAKIENIPDIIKLKSKKTDHHTLYNELTSFGNQILRIIDEEEEKLKDETIKNTMNTFDLNENDLRAAVKYYNDNATDITHYTHKFPANIIRKVAHFEEVEFYKIKKRERFEILNTTP